MLKRKNMFLFISLALLVLASLVYAGITVPIETVIPKVKASDDEKCALIQGLEMNQVVKLHMIRGESLKIIKQEEALGSEDGCMTPAKYELYVL